MRKENSKKIGEIGEDVACAFLVKRGFRIVERNYWKKWGEIDIVAKKSGILRFIEVKSVSRETIKSEGNNVIRETSGDHEEHRPEENVHPKKLERLSRAIQSYLMEKEEEDTEWQLDVMAVFLDTENKRATCRLTENVIL